MGVIYKLALLTLFAGLIASCNWFEFPSGYSESTEESYYLQGWKDYSTSDGENLAQSDLEAVSTVMDSLFLDTGLYYRVTSKQDGTQLRSADVVISGFSENAAYEASDPLTYGEPEGTLSVSGDECYLILVFPFAPEGYSDVTLTGSFDRKAAQTAIDRLRKSFDAYGESNGNERFTIHWTMNGIDKTGPFTITFDQEFGARKLRYRTPI